MKSKYCPVFLSLVLAMVSCQQKEWETPAPRGSQELVFTAGLADASETRTHFQREGDVLKTVWDANESISIFYGGASTNGGSKFTSTNDQPTEEASFSGVLDAFTGMNEGGQSLSFWSIYPYASDNAYDGDETVTLTLPTVQTAVEENISMNTYPMVAKTSGLSLSFYNVGTLLRVCVSSPDITGIVFRGNNGEVVSGRVSVTMDSDGRPVWSRIAGQGKTYVTLKAPEGDTFEVGKYYYIAFLPQTFSNGWSLSFQKAGSAENPGSFGFYKKTDSAVFERAKSKNASNRDQGINFSSFVDMGNGLKIATVNIGGDLPEDAGERFAWGETTTKASYSWNNYFWGTSSSALTKYNATDGKLVLDPEDDAATVICGEGWHMPTVAEWQSLLANCDVTFDSDGTVRLTSKADNSKWLKLYLRPESNATTSYWTSSLYSSGSSYARVTEIKNSDQTIKCFYSDSRSSGNYIRAIYTPPVHVTTISLNKGALNLTVGRSETLVATITPSDASKLGIQWTSSDDAVATVDENGTVTAVAVGVATITARTVDGGYTATCAVAVDASQNQSYVDMGSGHFGAVCNLGADFPEEFGDYYAWGELEPKDEYSFSAYDFDNTAFADAASHVLGDDWCTPAYEDYEWLLDNCDRAWVDNYNDSGISGYRFISREDSRNEIFFPAAGYKFNSNHNYANQEGYYGSSSIKASENDRAFYLFFSASEINGSEVQRPLGLSIRPVFRPKVSVTGISLNASSLSLYVGDTYQLSATLAPDNASEQGVVWSSSNESVVTVNVIGEVEAVGAGVATIVATTLDGRFTATCTVTVNAKYVKMGPNQWWATCNLGADLSDYFFQWGNTTPNVGSGWSNNIWGDSALSISKYQFPDGNTNASWYSNGVFNGDGIGVLESEDDAATAFWGEGWRIPTRSDWEWLIDNCIWMWDDEGFVVISKASGCVGNQIFLPVSQQTYYWSSTINGHDSAKAYAMDMDEREEYYGIGSVSRASSYAIRPVHSPKIDVTGITLNETSLTFGTYNATATLIATITPSNASEKHVAWASSNPSVASVSDDGVVKPLSEGTTTITAIIDQNKRATCTVTVKYLHGTLNGHDWVDMGNGLKWATMNVGAISPEESGDYVAWGEPDKKPLVHDYSWSTYFDSIGGSSDYFSKYYLGGVTTLTSNQDAASSNWGSTWRMPTAAEWSWLLENCTWTYTSLNEKSGFLVTATNGYTIFLPCAGFMDGNSISSPNDGFYWSSSLSTSSSAHAIEVYLNWISRTASVGDSYRYLGELIRPVSD